MLVATTWSVVAALTALYSVALWLIHGFSVWSLSSVGALADYSPAGAGLALPAWVGIWVPAEWQDLMRVGAETAGPWMEAALAYLPSLAQWLTPLAWGVWVLGVLLLLAGGGVVQVLARLARKTSYA